MPVRAGPEFALTVKLTVPLPLPLAPEVMLIQLSAVVLTHVQPVAVVTVTAPALPPAAATVCARGLIATVHPLVCVTVCTCPPTATVPVRAGPVFAPTVKFTEP